jgi:hypothetical protein
MMNNKKHEAGESKGKHDGKGKCKDMIKGDYRKMESLMRGKPSQANGKNYKGR